MKTLSTLTPMPVAGTPRTGDSQHEHSHTLEHQFQGPLTLTESVFLGVSLFLLWVGKRVVRKRRPTLNKDRRGKSQ
jgi:hypothetical protein